MILYHGTTLTAALKMIKDKEMVPQGSKGTDSLNLTGNPDYNPANYLGYLFFTDEMWLAVEYCSIAMSNVGDYTTGNIMIVLQLDIPEELFLPDFCDSPDKDCWKRSLEEVHQISVKGNLPIDYLQKILFIDYECPEMVVKEATIETLSSVLNGFNFKYEKKRTA